MCINGAPGIVQSACELCLQVEFHLRTNVKRAVGLTQRWTWAEVLVAGSGACAQRSPASSWWRSSVNLPPTCTCRVCAASRWRRRCVCPRHRWRSGSRTDASSTRSSWWCRTTAAREIGPMTTTMTSPEVNAVTAHVNCGLVTESRVVLTTVSRKLLYVDIDPLSPNMSLSKPNFWRLTFELHTNKMAAKQTILDY